MFEIDVDGCFVNVHTPDEAMLIMPPSEFIGRSSSELMDMAVHGDLCGRCTTGCGPTPTEVDVVEYTTEIYEGGLRSFECRIVPRSSGGLVAVVRDITGQAERARLLREHSARLARANEDLERAVRAKDEFLAGVGHELRTPLSAVLGLTEILLDDEVTPLTPPQQSAIETIPASGTHLLSLINDLLDLDQITNRMATLDLGSVELVDVVRLALDLVRTSADRSDVRLELDEGHGIPGDPRRRPAPRPGPAQPARERGEVHPGGRHGRGRPLDPRPGPRGRGHVWAHGHRPRPEGPTAGCSSRSCRWIRGSTGATSARAWG